MICPAEEMIKRGRTLQRFGANPRRFNPQHANPIFGFASGFPNCNQLQSGINGKYTLGPFLFFFTKAVVENTS